MCTFQCNLTVLFGIKIKNCVYFRPMDWCQLVVIEHWNRKANHKRDIHTKKFVSCRSYEKAQQLNVIPNGISLSSSSSSSNTKRYTTIATITNKNIHSKETKSLQFSFVYAYDTQTEYNDLMRLHASIFPIRPIPVSNAVAAIVVFVIASCQPFCVTWRWCVICYYEPTHSTQEKKE